MNKTESEEQTAKRARSNALARVQIMKAKQGDAEARQRAKKNGFVSIMLALAAFALSFVVVLVAAFGNLVAALTMGMLALGVCSVGCVFSAIALRLRPDTLSAWFGMIFNLGMLLVLMPDLWRLWKLS